jgi:ElaA protein
MMSDGGRQMAETELVIKDTAELTAAELIAIMRARVRVFVVEQNCPYQEVDAKDDTARHVMLQRGGQLIAYARIVPHDDGVHMSFGLVLVVQEYRQQHLGRQLVAATIAEMQRLYPGQPIKIQAQNYLRDFYASFGFTAVSDVYLEDGIPHVDMIKA